MYENYNNTSPTLLLYQRSSAATEGVAVGTGAIEEKKK